MSEALYLVLGILIIGLGIYDLLYTTFAPRGAGPVSSCLSSFLWRLFLGASNLLKTRKAFRGAGIVIIMSTILSWLLLLWTGYTLLYFSDARAVVDSTTEVPADNWDRIYFTGYTLSTLGNGDFKGGTQAWRILTAFISFTGLVLITTAITYMVPILSATTERRSLSIDIAAIGDSPQQMLLNSWNGEDFKSLEQHLSGLAQPVAKQGQLHLAYPLLHYFYHAERSVALLLNLVALDEALTILLLYVPKEKRPSDQSLVPVRHAITTFLESLTAITPTPKDPENPHLDLKQLKEAGVPLQLQEEKLPEEVDKRRRALLAMLQYLGWEWEEVSKPKFITDLDLRSVR